MLVETIDIHVLQAEVREIRVMPLFVDDVTVRKLKYMQMFHL